MAKSKAAHAAWRPKDVPDSARLLIIENSTCLPSLNALLKPTGFRLRCKGNYRELGDWQYIWVEPIPAAAEVK